MPYKAIKKFEFDGVTFKIGDTVPDRLIVERLINASTLVQEVETNEVEELLLETPSAIEVTIQEVETNEVKEELMLETTFDDKVVEEKPSKNKNKK